MSALKSSYFDWLRFLQEEYPNIGKRIVVCLEQKPRRTEDGSDILPAARFSELLWDGALF